jgi:hypothetical protein
MILNVENVEIMCYYKIDPGGCPTCGYDTEIGNPTLVELYMSNNIDDLVNYCMSTSEVNDAYMVCAYHNTALKKSKCKS